MDWSQFLPTVDEGVAVGFFVVVSGIVVWSVRYFAPVQKQKMVAQAEASQKQAELADSLKISTAMQTQLMSQQGGMLRDHGLTLTEHGHILSRHGESLQRIERRVCREDEGDT